MKSITLKPNAVFKQVMLSNNENPIIGRSNVWVVCQKKGDEVGEIVRKPYQSLTRATTAWRKRIEKHGKDSGWVVITSDALASCGFIWL